MNPHEQTNHRDSVMDKNDIGFGRYYKNAILSAIQLAAGTTARGDDLVQKIRELRLGAERAKRLEEKRCTTV